MRILSAVATLLILQFAVRADETTVFHKQVAPILQRKCLRCHNESTRKGKLSLATSASFLKGGRHGALFVAGKPEKSMLIEMVTPVDGEAEMPKNAPTLSKSEIATLSRWIREGASWPKNLRLKPMLEVDVNWWSLQAMRRPKLPTLTESEKQWTRNPIDTFIRTRHRENNLTPSPEADRRALIRRLYYDLIGLPPSPRDVDRFLKSDDPLAYEKLVDRLLASPRYGERWARHWLDVVHYADTHGYDKDKLRPNAWPYRDYVIRAFNQDKVYSRFVREQIAGDALYPGTRDGVVALGFLSAGPWDFIGHAEVPETKIDGKVARNLDRDDMVTVTMGTFNSLTVGCARCHDHKFDPITQEHYYGLQAVFASLDRADRMYDADPTIADRRHQLTKRKRELTQRRQQLEEKIRGIRTPEIIAIDKQIATLSAKLSTPIKGRRSPAYGYHSQVARSRDVTKWVQVDLGKELPINHVLLVGADEYGFADFGFPERYRVEISNDARFKTSKMLLDQTASDVLRPGDSIVKIDAKEMKARFIRVTATQLWERRHRGQKGRGDWIFALGELAVISQNRFVKPKTVTALDSIEALPRWGKRDLIDGVFGTLPLAQRVGTRKESEQIAKLLTPTNQDQIRKRLAELTSKRQALVERIVSRRFFTERANLGRQLASVNADLSRLPPQSRAYVATVHRGSGTFRGRAGLGPREIRLLKRGDVTRPGKLVQPGALPLIPKVPTTFRLKKNHTEEERRIALADWITHRQNPLTWRSIVNRIWQYHMGKGLVTTPNDFGRMGQKPSHPQLLDWLAIEFRDGGRWLRAQSIKSLHRLIVTSATYRQASKDDARMSKKDGNNQYLWRMNRRRLDAESIRDSVLLLSGKLRSEMGGPGFRDFVLEKPQHSPHYEYGKHNPDDPSTHRRAVYRFLVRSQQEPFMETLDCADPSQMVARRHTSLTALQALTLLNNKLMLRMAEHFASRLKMEKKTLAEQVTRAYRLALSRSPRESELNALTTFSKKNGLENLCRVLFNLNEFVFVD